MTLTTHFISVIKSYLHCWNQHQSWQAVTTRLNMFSGLKFSFLQFNFINSNVSLIEYPEFSSVVECAFSGGFIPSSNRERFSFCSNGFCALDDFKHSEVKWRQLPWMVLLESMTACRPAQQCTKVERLPSVPLLYTADSQLS
jgi:hypothetical protein